MHSVCISLCLWGWQRPLRRRPEYTIYNEVKKRRLGRYFSLITSDAIAAEPPLEARSRPRSLGAANWWLFWECPEITVEELALWEPALAWERKGRRKKETRGRNLERSRNRSLNVPAVDFWAFSRSTPSRSSKWPLSRSTPSRSSNWWPLSVLSFDPVSIINQIVCYYDIYYYYYQCRIILIAIAIFILIIVFILV